MQTRFLYHNNQGALEKASLFFCEGIEKSDAAQKICVDYFTFGWQLPGRNGSSTVDDYRHSFNGMEKDDEIKGDGNSYDFGARIYDSRVGRWLSRDPHESMYPSLSPYCFVGNSTIAFRDPNGKDGILTIDYNTKTVTYSTTVSVYGATSTEAGNTFVQSLNSQYDALTNTYYVQDPDDPEVCWTVIIDVEFVYNECIDEYASNHGGTIGTLGTNTDDFEVLYKNGIVCQGDNLYQINREMGVDSGPDGGAEIGGNEAVGSEDFRVVIHEIFHLLGFDERYLRAEVGGYTYGPYEGDVLSNDAGSREIMAFHFVDLLDWALDSYPKPESGKVNEVVGNRGRSKANPEGKRLRIDDTGEGTPALLIKDALDKATKDGRATPQN